MLRQGINIGNCQDAKEHVNVSVSQLFSRCIGPIESLEKIAAQGINMIAPKVSWWLPLWKKLRSHNSNRLWRSSSPSLHIGFICFMAMGRLWKVAASVRCDPLIHSTLKASSRSTWRRNSQVVPTKTELKGHWLTLSHCHIVLPLRDISSSQRSFESLSCEPSQRSLKSKHKRRLPARIISAPLPTNRRSHAHAGPVIVPSPNRWFWTSIRDHKLYNQNNPNLCWISWYVRLFPNMIGWPKSEAYSTT